jgi:hypothetical protein
MIDEQTLREIENTRMKYEFMTFIVMKDNILVGIIQNETPKIIRIYEFDCIKSIEEKERFLQFGDEWWWGSNHSVPINMFIGDRFEQYEYCLHGYSRKSIEDMIGPTFSLADKYSRRVKKKRIEILIPTLMD